MITNLLVGFVIIEQGDNRCLLKAITNISKSEYDTTLRRAFLIVITMGNSIVKNLESNRLADLRNLLTLEHTNNQLTNFCERIINKFGSMNSKGAGPEYIIPWNMEKVCDCYKNICKHLSSPENNTKKVSKDVTLIMKKLNEYFDGYYKLYYNYKMEDYVSLNKQRYELMDKIKNTFNKASKHEYIVLSYLHEAIERSTDFAASIIALKLI